MYGVDERKAAMPWRPGNLADEREEFVRLAQSGDEYFSRLCRLFGYSLNRYVAIAALKAAPWLPLKAQSLVEKGGRSRRRDYRDGVGR